MSGFEIAGVILGSLPIIFKAADEFRKTCRRIKSGVDLEATITDFAQAINLQQDLLEQVVVAILVGCGIEDLSQLESDPYGYLNLEETREDMRDFLGPRKCTTFCMTIERIHRIVQTIAKSMTGLVPGYKGPSDDLLALIEANKQQRTSDIQFRPRMSAAFYKNDISMVIDELNEVTHNLAEFSKWTLFNHHTLNRLSPQKTLKMTKVFRSIRQLAWKLSCAISESWQPQCHIRHEAKLFLDDRADTKSELYRPLKRKSWSPKLVFKIAFVAEVQPERETWHETLVKVYEKSPSVLSPATACGGARTSFVGIPEEVPPVFTTITDICTAVNHARAQNQHVEFGIFEKDELLSTLEAHKSNLHDKHIKVVSLQSILLLQDIDVRMRLLPLWCRVYLALQSASSLVQLSQTRWVPHILTKSSLFFPYWCPMTSSTTKVLDAQRPFVSLRIDAQETVTTDSRLNNALLELGILLLELWHVCTWESWVDQDIPPDDFEKRRKAALHWLNSTHDTPPASYTMAVLECLEIAALPPSFVDWKNSEFLGRVCGGIIEPLSENGQMWQQKLK